MFAFVATLVAALNLVVGSLCLAQGSLFWGVANVVIGVLLAGAVLAEEG